MDAPDELRQTVRSVVRAWLDGTTGGRYTNEVADAVLAVPAIADALRAAERDAKVAEIVAEWDTTPTHDKPSTDSFRAMDSIWALFASGGAGS